MTPQAGNTYTNKHLAGQHTDGHKHKGCKWIRAPHTNKPGQAPVQEQKCASARSATWGGGQPGFSSARHEPYCPPPCRSQKQGVEGDRTFAHRRGGSEAVVKSERDCCCTGQHDQREKTTLRHARSRAGQGGLQSALVLPLLPVPGAQPGAQEQPSSRYIHTHVDDTNRGQTNALNPEGENPRALRV